MIAFIAQFVIFAASLVVTTICVATWAILIVRMWYSFRPSRKDTIRGTVCAVLLFGSFAGLCGFGAYTVLVSATDSLLRML